MNKHLDELITKAVSDYISEKLGMRKEIDIKQYDIPDCLETYQAIRNCDGCTKSLVLSFFINKELDADYVHFNRDNYSSIKTLEQFNDKLRGVIGEYKFNLIKPYQLGFMFNMLFD